MDKDESDEIATPEDSGETKRDWVRELYASGFAALVGAAALLGAAIWTGEAGENQSICGQAAELVMDDQFNEALNDAEKERIMATAERKLRECMND